MSAKEMVIQLKQLAEEGEIQESEVPEIKTVEGWITRYSASLRKESAEQRVMDGSRNQESVGNQKLIKFRNFLYSNLRFVHIKVFE
ncbi:hypothetical protein RhiirC2_736926 [Rhizophagus irregularis]|uniref:Uncharacterized protein n=1 Tax=Rhizophagus irregularis TaxID=588596 RepID=A0A2N1NHN5_9GLOM|nr:hypothetical protein RhiirC2_742427 [Rhizophagus irregularis]PKK73432.1 hypothetical protein RhiirC2_740781 [Rhizophagus irregularis]PKK75277.1 hypothetical protein RhiirC2_736926 [Rhizophagus irregularis]